VWLPAPKQQEPSGCFSLALGPCRPSLTGLLHELESIARLMAVQVYNGSGGGGVPQPDMTVLTTCHWDPPVHDADTCSSLTSPKDQETNCSQLWFCTAVCKFQGCFPPHDCGGS
jgi:hypothetical protein